MSENSQHVCFAKSPVVAAGPSVLFNSRFVSVVGVVHGVVRSWV